MSKDTSQKQRINPALSPEFFKVDDRSVGDFLEEAKRLAGLVAFTEVTAGKGAPVSWAYFFEGSEVPADTKGEYPPHLALFVAFLRLFRHPQQQLNALTASHLHLFYHNILQQERKAAIPDRVFVFLDLAKNVQHYALPASTELVAGTGKDKLGYRPERTVFLSHAKVGCFMAAHRQQGAQGSIVVFPEAQTTEEQGWHPFGTSGTAGVAAKIGFGVATPLLYLKGGMRIIRLSLNLMTANPELSSLIPSEFEAQLTGPEGWFSAAVTAVDYQETTLTFEIRLNEKDPSVSKPLRQLHGWFAESSGYPALSIVLASGFPYSRYTMLQAVRIDKISMQLQVEKIHPLEIKNDYGVLDGSKAFQPFGYTPAIGSNLYISHTELAIKPLDRITIRMNWRGVPESFKTYYEGYLGFTNSLVNTNEDFKVKIALRDQDGWHAMRNQTGEQADYPLFGREIDLDLPSVVSGTVYQARLSLSSPPQAFGHSLYPTVYAKSVLAQLQDKATPIPNEPFTPVMDSMELDYTGTADVPLFFHVGPFGALQADIRGASLLSGAFHAAGLLYIGIENLRPPQQLSLFFELGRQTAEELPDPEFYYLGTEGWIRLTGNQVLSDSTMGLKQTGILLLNLPARMRSDNPLMPEGFHWLRITVPDHAEDFPKVLSVRTNATTCISVQGHHVLPPGSIKSFSKKIAEVKKIEQPYGAFGGRPQESETAYFTRVSEQLRHKSRCIAAWDFERIILEQFPEIYKVRCLPHTGSDGKPSPGNVHIIVIPHIEPFSASRVLKPFVPASSLKQIKSHVESLASGNVGITVANPHYVEISIVAAVSFHPEMDAGVCSQQMELDLQRYLSPWAFEENAEIGFGGKFYRSSLIAFIESRYYVGFLASIRILQQGMEVIGEEITSAAQTIFVSAASHDIKAVESGNVLCQANQGIAQMIVDINFEIQ